MRPLHDGCKKHDGESVKGALVSSGYCAVLALDAKIAFNSTNWNRIKEKLVDVGVPRYLASVVKNYHSVRTLRDGTDVGPKECIITPQGPQGSVVSPVIWNVMYSDVHPVNCADNLAMVDYQKYTCQAAGPTAAYAKMLQNIGAANTVGDCFEPKWCDTFCFTIYQLMALGI